MSEEQTRETREITTPSGNVVVLKSYITAREAREIQNVYLSKVSLKQTSEGQSIEGLKGSATSEAEDMAVKVVVISVDGKTEGLVDIILDMRVEDNKTIKDAINEITNPQLDDEKKNV